MMGQWWAGPHLPQACLDVYSLDLLFKLLAHFRILKRYLGELTGSLCPSTKGGHIEQTSSFFFPFWVGLLKTGNQT